MVLTSPKAQVKPSKNSSGLGALWFAFFLGKKNAIFHY